MGLVLCRRPRGFGFIEFAYERDAEDAMNALDGKIWGGREITVPLSPALSSWQCDPPRMALRAF